MPNLKCLYLKGNPAVRNISNYRKIIIASIPSLTYLDDRPVFVNERRTAEAWLKGGKEGETSEREKIRDEATQRDKEYQDWVSDREEKAHRRREKELEKIRLMEEREAQ